MQGDFFLTTWFLEAMKWVYSNVNSVFFNHTHLHCGIEGHHHFLGYSHP